ncbi:MAG: hypothetical protein Harvfovirus3_49 [Harvfovirus sp.]|uniref:Uncharacterized protein n=1 Tax=Harvfovirus sp. TaxID=2487768 RepID=A0A3G5A271_9VIRU|nr:MAG: hypothetical protein Harvfovirus3_49 [Harvfovirus sp.]
MFPVIGSFVLYIFHCFLRMSHNIPDAVPVGPVVPKSKLCKKALMVSVLVSILAAVIIAHLSKEEPIKDTNGCHGSPLKNWRCNRNFSCQRFEDCPNYENIYVRVQDHHDIYYAKAVDMAWVVMYGTTKDNNSVCLDSVGLIVEGNIKKINPHNINICKALLTFTYYSEYKGRHYLDLRSIYSYDLMPYKEDV